MSDKKVWWNLISTYVIFGIINLLAAFAFSYFSSIQLIEERTGEQMASVRSLASEKLRLYLDHLKIMATSTPLLEAAKKAQVMSLQHVLVKEGEQFKTVFGSDYQAPSELQAAVAFKFHLLPDNQLLLKVNRDHQEIFWIFHNHGLNSVLEQREGLGESGEIYLVGEDFKIKSASRHVKDWQGITVNNESTRLALQKKYGVHNVKDYRGEEVVSSFSEFIYDDLKFILLSEIDRAEVFRPLKNIISRIFLLSLLLLSITIVYALFSSRKIYNLITRMRQEINNFSFKLINAQEEERRKVSYNLHDGAGQTLSAMKWGLNQIKEKDPKIPEIVTLCDDAINEIRNLSNDLMPSGIKELGCFIAIKEYLRKQEDYLDIKIDYWFSDRLEEQKFREGFDVNLYRMVQEFMQNTVKHAGASKVSLVIFKQEDQLVIRFEDDGKARMKTPVEPRTIKYRTELMDGTLNCYYEHEKLVFLVSVPMGSIFV